ncbi:unnamed protein product [Phytomonas sp. Hart1]|nr:unnamed protein product [Phytomonas sp. Hart1]|eukprot:CCW71858.1 unnamed protein product [Phytomonas sp. isolate Hart1]
MRQRFLKKHDASAPHSEPINQHQSQDSTNTPEFEEIIRHNSQEVTCLDHFKNTPMCGVTEAFFIVMDILPRPLISCLVPDIPLHFKNMLTNISEDYIKPYNRENPSHVDLLRRLWKGHHKVMFNDIPFEFVHERWRELGFQSDDPSRDFRAAGIFALGQLVYLVETYPNHWSRFLASKDFILSCVAINVSMRIITLLELIPMFNVYSSKFSQNYTTLSAKARLCNLIYSTNSKVSFCLLADVFCCYMCVLEKTWVESGKSLLEFNQVLEKFLKRFDRTICMSKSIDDLYTL